jgi:hypothetical protein
MKGYTDTGDWLRAEVFDDVRGKIRREMMLEEIRRREFMQDINTERWSEDMDLPEKNCELCGEPLVRMKNDWAGRRYHKKCWAMLCHMGRSRRRQRSYYN